MKRLALLVSSVPRSLVLHHCSLLSLFHSRFMKCSGRNELSGENAGQNDDCNVNGGLLSKEGEERCFVFV